MEENQYAYSGPHGLAVLMGRLTWVRVIRVDGLVDNAPIFPADHKRQGSHGARATHQTYEGRLIILELAIEGTNDGTADDVEVRREELMSVFQSFDQQGTFLFRRRGKTTRTARVLVRRTFFSADWDSQTGLSKGAVELFAEDPRFYAETPVITNAPLPNPNLGRTYNRTYSYTYPTNGGGVVVVDNIGNMVTWPQVILRGPWENPSISSISHGKTLLFNLTIPDGKFLVVNFDNHSILLDGLNARGALSKNTRSWFGIEPGENTWIMAGTTGVGAQATILWRPAWGSG